MIEVHTLPGPKIRTWGTRFGLVNSMGHGPPAESILGINVVLLSALKGGFFLRKKPLESELSVYSDS
jgi:hypothetical protein